MLARMAEEDANGSSSKATNGAQDEGVIVLEQTPQLKVSHQTRKGI